MAKKYFNEHNLRTAKRIVWNSLRQSNRSQNLPHHRCQLSVLPQQKWLLKRSLIGPFILLWHFRKLILLEPCYTGVLIPEIWPRKLSDLFFQGDIEINYSSHSRNERIFSTLFKLIFKECYIINSIYNHIKQTVLITFF